MKVNTLIIGAARSATTSLSQILDQHPDICLSRPKEPQFFSDPDWREKIETYHNCFHEEAKIYLDASTNYSKYPAFNKHIHQDIKEYNVHMKLVYIMRHPIDRMISHYKFSLERGLTKDDLETALRQNPIYMNASNYILQIESYLDHFDKNQLLLLTFDEFQKFPEKVLQKTTDFLGIDEFHFDLSKSHLNKSNSGAIGHIKYDKTPTLPSKLKKLWHYIMRQLRPSKIDSKLNPEFREELIERYTEDIKKLEILLNEDLTHWMR